jgi:flagellar basal body rod protein FlgG
MLRSVYSAAYAMQMSARNHEIVAENLVHATTPGYRRQASLYEASPASLMPPTTSGGAAAPAEFPQPQSYTYFEQGPLQQTNNPLDFAVSGNTFFVVEGPNGPLYTRNGSFEVTPTGELRTRGGGYRVSGQGGAITVPVDSGPIVVGSDGTITANGAQVGRLQLADFPRLDSLRRVGPTLFEGDAPQAPPASVRVDQGYREGSNVQAVQEMISMMVGMRHYEAASKVLQTINDSVSQNTRAQQA